MTRLNQIIAVEKGVRSEASRQLTDTYHALQKPQPLGGIARTYRPKDDEGDRLPSEQTRVQYTATDVLDRLIPVLGRMWDVVATKDLTNQEARADVVVDGAVIWIGVPVATLLYLEKQLVDVITLAEKLPLLDPAENWTWDATAGSWASNPTETTRTRKVMRNHVLVEATEHHPAQVQTYTEDQVVGYWTTTRFSGAMPADDVRSAITRARTLLDAVRRARETANMTEVLDVRGVGERLLTYVFGERRR